MAAACGRNAASGIKQPSCSTHSCAWHSCSTRVWLLEVCELGTSGVLAPLGLGDESTSVVDEDACESRCLLSPMSRALWSKNSRSFVIAALAVEAGCVRTGSARLAGNSRRRLERARVVKLVSRGGCSPSAGALRVELRGSVFRGWEILRTRSVIGSSSRQPPDLRHGSGAADCRMCLSGRRASRLAAKRHPALRSAAKAAHASVRAAGQASPSASLLRIEWS